METRVRCSENLSCSPLYTGTIEEEFSSILGELWTHMQTCVILWRQKSWLTADIVMGVTSRLNRSVAFTVCFAEGGTQGAVPAVTCTELWKAGLIIQSQNLFQALVVMTVPGDMRVALEWRDSTVE